MAAASVGQLRGTTPNAASVRPPDHRGPCGRALRGSDVAEAKDAFEEVCNQPPAGGGTPPY